LTKNNSLTYSFTYSLSFLNYMKLHNRVAIITGGARGIGQASAELFAQEGAQVVIWDVAEAGQETAQAIAAQGGRAEFMSVNSADFAQVLAAAAAVKEKYGRIDILINNAGITRDASFLKMTHEQWHQVLDVNLTGVFNCTKAVAPYMVEGKYGRIVTTSSIVGLYGNFGQTNYVATKSAVIGMTKVWARELGKYGITANAVAPGFIKTDMTAAMPPEMLEGAAAKVPVRRLGEPIDIARAYLFLASEDASFINGATLSVDGGAVS
jgi:3-oxoacyl-[acyl-carrier protein] reductase